MLGSKEDASVEVELFLSETNRKKEGMIFKRVFSRKNNSSRWFINKRYANINTKDALMYLSPLDFSQDIGELVHRFTSKMAKTAAASSFKYMVQFGNTRCPSVCVMRQTPPKLSLPFA